MGCWAELLIAAERQMAQCATSCLAPGTAGYRFVMALVLWLLAVILVISGIVALLRKELVYGIVLIIVGFLVGPGGVSVFT